MDKHTLEAPCQADAYFAAALQCFRDGLCCDAVKMCEDLVDREYFHAYTLLGLLYEKPTSNQIEKSYEKAFTYYKCSTETVGAMEGWLGLARLYYLGFGVAKDREKAAELYGNLCEHDDAPVAQVMLGRMHLDGEGVVRDVAKAREYLLRARNQGFAWAYSHLGTADFMSGRYLHGVMNRLIAVFLLCKYAKNDDRRRQI